MEGFKNFIMRGNLIELAVAFIIGGAFGTVVKDFTAIVMDLIGKLGGTPNFSSFVPGGIHVGAFLTSLIAFLILAFVVYFGVVKPYEFAKEKLTKKEEEETPATSEELLTEIRDLLAQQRNI